MNLKQIISDGFKSGKLERRTQNEILSLLHLSPSYKKPAKSILKQFISEGVILKTDGGRYVSPEKAGAFYATVKASPRGFAFLIPDGFAERENDCFVPAKKLFGALDRDRVLAVPTGHGDEAAIVKIVSRGRQTVTGRLTRLGRYYRVLPDDMAYAADVLIPSALLYGAADGDKVIAEITGFSGNTVNGKIIEILGRDGDFHAEEEAIIASAELRREFPDYVEKTAVSVAHEDVLTEGRRDLRDLITVTIDGADTRDIDDAVSVEYDGEKYRLGVHIADVSRYVKPNGCIDKEAYERGTSVYFPDRVLPMLPEALSNYACSLNENEDRYAVTCFMHFDKKGKRTGFELCESVIRSDRRMTYDEVTEILEKGEETDCDLPQIAPMLRHAAKLCELLEKRRKKAGEVSLDVKEAHIYLDERGEIVIPEYNRALSHRMIEQFMVSANETVAEFAQKHKLPFLYRIHERPSPEKAALLLSFVKDLGINVTFDAENAVPADFQKILNKAEDKPFAAVVSKVMLRSMQKARYSQTNVGHFGLASECYCHFTSPIRRYPDLFVHRALKLLLHGKEDEARKKLTAFAKAAAVDCSERERRAEQAERDVDDLYKLAYMQKRLGEEFDAVISGVVESGVFAELTFAVEGMIRIESLPADRYEYIPEKFLLKGTRHAFRLGDKIRIKVAGCDLGTRRVQFVPV